jgi:hypothetical protein
MSGRYARSDWEHLSITGRPRDLQRNGNPISSPKEIDKKYIRFGNASAEMVVWSYATISLPKSITPSPTIPLARAGLQSRDRPIDPPLESRLGGVRL